MLEESGQVRYFTKQTRSVNVDHIFVLIQFMIVKVWF